MDMIKMIYSEILGEVERKLKEGETAKKELNLSDKKNRVLKAENARLYRQLDEAKKIIQSHESFIDNLTEYNARLLQENRQLRQLGAAAPVADGQLTFFNLDEFMEDINEAWGHNK